MWPLVLYCLNVFFLALFSLPSSLCLDDKNIEIHGLNYGDSENEIAEGKRLYEEITRQVFTYGDCWEKAVLELRTGCKHLTEEVQSHLALSFANCFLEKSGLEGCHCPAKNPIKDCLKNSNDRVFATYREFFTHTQSICYFLQHKVWQEHTENTIQKLAANSVKVSKQLHESSASQSKILELQQTSLKKQQLLINTSKNLNNELEKSRDNVKAVFDEFKVTTNEHRMLIFEIFDRIKRLQSVVVGEFSGFHTFIFYLVAVILSYLLTSTPRTSEARFWLLVLVTINAVLERIIASYSMNEETESQILLDSNGPLYHRVWICRKVSCTVACFLLVWCSYKYKDYNAINNKLLLEIQNQNLEIKNYVRNMGGHLLSSASDGYNSDIEKINHVFENKGHQLESTLLSDTTLDLPSDLYSSSDNSCILANEITLFNEQNQQPNNGREVISEHSEKITMVPFNQKSEVVEIPNKNPEDLYSPTGRYNLRPRTPQSKEKIVEESPHSFARTVETLARISSRNSQKIRRKMKQHKSQKYFSSDDD